MGRLDNDETKGIARPFLVLAHVRTGGTFCCHALSNHPQIHCDRGESMHHLSVWRKAGIKPGQICRLLWNQTGYRASGFRMIYGQAFHTAVWPAIEDKQPHLIHLRRRSLIRQALSYAYQQQVRAGALKYHPVHTFEERRPPRQAIRIDQAVDYVNKIDKQQRHAKTRLADYDGAILDVLYEDMVEDVAGSASRMAPGVAKTICGFLGVNGYLDLRVDLKRDFPVSMPRLFENWREIEAALRSEGYGDAVDYELDYWEQIGG